MRSILLKKNIVRRNKYKCTKCLKEISSCAAWGCYNYVKVERGHKYCKPCINASDDSSTVHSYWSWDASSSDSCGGNGGGDGGGGGD